jgi:hypothetical protein
MEPVITYFVKMVLCSVILLGYYWLALRNERFHRWNRFYLLTAFVLSIIVPLLNIPLLLEEKPDVMVNMVASLPWNKLPAAAPSFSWNGETVLVLAVLIISMILLLHIIASVIKVVLIYRSSESTFFNDVSVVVTKDTAAPFSFFRWLFWRHDIDPGSENGCRMLKHELTHISEKHSADKLLVELLLVVFWMNPFFWILRRELYAIHEFSADREAIGRNDGAAFAAMILQAAHTGSTPAFSNPFFTSQLKRRLIMITTSPAANHSYLRRISGLVLMLLTTAVLVLSIERAQAQQKTAPPPLPPTPQVQKTNALPDSIKSVEVIETNGVSYITYEMKDGRRLVYDLDEARKKNYYIPAPPPPAPAPPVPVAVPATPPVPPKKANNKVVSINARSQNLNHSIVSSQNNNVNISSTNNVNAKINSTNHVNIRPQVNVSLSPIRAVNQVNVKLERLNELKFDVAPVISIEPMTGKDDNKK